MKVKEFAVGFLWSTFSLACAQTESARIFDNIGTISFTSVLFDLITIDDPALAPIVQRLSGSQATTLFAPTDDAFNALDERATQFLLNNPRVLADVLLYHVTDSIVPSSAFSTAPTQLISLQGNNLVAQIQQRGACVFEGGFLCLENLFVNDSRVLIDDIFASNGVIHIIDEVLSFPGLIPQSDLVDTVSEAGLGTLDQLLFSADLVGILRSEGPFTVFAPSNSAFSALPDDFIFFLLQPAGNEVLIDILLYHVIIGSNIASSDLSTVQVVETALQESITINSSTDLLGQQSIIIGDSTDTVATVIQADVFALNGIAHVIDKVLIPPGLIINGSFDGDLVDIAVSAELDILVEALERADLEDTLRSTGPFTVFAPVDEAFEALSERVITVVSAPEGITVLQDILLYHVIPGQNIEAKDLIADLPVQTALGEDLEVTRDGEVGEEENLFIIDSTSIAAKVIQADVFAQNGVAHVIDKVLIPPGLSIPDSSIPDSFDGDLVDIAVSAELDILVEALERADLDGTLRSTGPFTVFAPVDEAFEALPEELVTFLSAPVGVPVLQDILLFHVVVGLAITSDDIGEAVSIDTGLGDLLIIRKDRTVTDDGNLVIDIFIEDSTDTPAQVIQTDIVANNGIAHVIDKVLIPRVTLG